MSAIKDYYTPQEFYVNKENVTKIVFYLREKCKFFKWCDKRYVKHWWTKKPDLVRKEGFYDTRLSRGLEPMYSVDGWGDKLVYLLSELKDPEKNPFWQKFDGEYSLNYVDTEIFIRPYVEITYNDGSIDRYWFWTDEELNKAKYKFFNLDEFNYIKNNGNI